MLFQMFKKIFKNKITIDVLQLSETKDELLSSLAKKTDGLDFLIQGKNEILDISDSIISFANQEMSKLPKPANLFTMTAKTSC